MVDLRKMASVEYSSQVFKERLKCKICENGLKAGKLRWFRCPLNHQVCQDCKAKCKKCPCGKNISEFHCEIVEDLLKAKSMRFSCSNESRGCQESSGEEAMIHHEGECTYRLINCPHTTCKSKVPFHELLNHLETTENCKPSSQHNLKQNLFGCAVMRFRLSKEHIENEKFSFSPAKIILGDKVFFFTSKKLSNREIYTMWIQMYGSKYEAKDYAYTVILKGNAQNQKVLSMFKSEVIPIDEDSKSISDGNKYFGICFKVFKELFINEDQTFRVDVTIMNVKDEKVKNNNEESGVSDKQ